MDISLPDLTMKSLDDSDYESRENTICEDVKVRGVCFRELGIQFHSTSLVMGMFLSPQDFNVYCCVIVLLLLLLLLLLLHDF